jgi:hypothetical protein
MIQMLECLQTAIILTGAVAKTIERSTKEYQQKEKERRSKMTHYERREEDLANFFRRNRS